MGIRVVACNALQLLANQPVTFCSEKQTAEIISHRLTIPVYQRPYCWQETQILKLLQDIERHQMFYDENHPYYLGSIILHNEGDVLNIIDGQQRLTTLALIGFLGDYGQFKEPPLRFSSLQSQKQISQNINWLNTNRALWKSDLIHFERIYFTLVITDSEDSAYKFFETQNTGGQRLSGPDIIKAHHLRGVHQVDESLVADYAKRWESFFDLAKVIDLLLRGRYWQLQQLKDYPLHSQPVLVKEAIVNELAENTGQGTDLAYGRVIRERHRDGSLSLLFAETGYDVRQPLNQGINTIHYLEYFTKLYHLYLIPAKDTSQSKNYRDFKYFYRTLVCQLDGCSYLKQLFDSCLLLFISQFGDDKLGIAAVKLFRVVYSPRLSNPKAVRERTVPAFVKQYPITDWIVQSFTAEQCFQKLDSFQFKVDRTGLESKGLGVKKRFVDDVSRIFKLPDDPDYQHFATSFDQAVRKMGAS